VLQDNSWILLGVLILSFSASILSVPFLKKVAFKFEIIDRPNQAHKTHFQPIPYLGGVAVIIPVLIVSVFSLRFFPMDSVTILQGGILIFPGLILAAMGLIDDKTNLPVSARFTIQLITSVLISMVLAQGGYTVQLTKFPALDYLISILWIVGITNAFNLLDNLDGGVAGIAAISSITIFGLSLAGNQSLIAILSLTICGGSVGFLYWNRNPASIYLGDSGALFVGLMLSVLLLQFEASSSGSLNSIATPVLIMAVPIIDTSVVVVSRIRRKISIFRGGRDHIAHRLLGLGYSRRQSAYLIWGLGTYFAFFAIAINNFNFLNQVTFSTVGLISLLVVALFFLRLPHL